MPRLLLLLSLVSLAAAFAARWWFGLRVLATEGEQLCKCDLATWFPGKSGEAVVHRADGTADSFGRQLRMKAMEEWAEEQPKAAASRENSRRFGQAVPPLSIIIAVFALIVAKVPFLGAVAIIVAATSLAAVLGVLTLTPELQAIHRAAKKARAVKAFPDRDQETIIIRCALAHSWKEAFPPILKLIQK